MEFIGCGKLECPKKTLPQCYFVNHRSLGFILGLCSEKPVSNCPSYTTAKIQFNTTLLSTTKQAPPLWPTLTLHNTSSVLFHHLRYISVQLQLRNSTNLCCSFLCSQFFDWFLWCHRTMASLHRLQRTEAKVCCKSWYWTIPTWPKELEKHYIMNRVQVSAFCQEQY
jgi:hypothetical protein